MSKKTLEEAQNAESELDMTSMIDVVFLLLIFFMCATKFKVPEGSLRAFLPRDRGGPAASPTITRGCRITLGAQDSGEVRIMIDEKMVPLDDQFLSDYEHEFGLLGPNEDYIMAHLEDRRENYEGLGSKGLPVIIDFGKRVPVKYVVQMLNLCHRAEIQDISFAAPEIPIE